ncbi:MAG: sulfotransferase [Bauldia sp.]|nr:sulfotransferase [Bauldia sp.]
MARKDRLSPLFGLRWRGAGARRREQRLGFFGIGAQKGGTTSLDRLLRLHPDLELPSGRKELHYFDDDARFDGLDPRDGYARLHGPFFFDRTLAGEITPSYVYWPAALERIRHYNPDARLVLLLRNPVHRAWSHWGHLDRKARAKRDPDARVGRFRQRLRREARALAADPGFSDKGLSHLGRSLYAPQIERLRALFPADQILILRSERFFADQHGVTDEVCRFLGVAPLTAVATPPAVHANVGSGRGISPKKWEAAYRHFEADIDAVERLLGWDCSDWRQPPEPT